MDERPEQCEYDFNLFIDKLYPRYSLLSYESKCAIMPQRIFRKALNLWINQLVGCDEWIHITFYKQEKNYEH